MTKIKFNNLDYKKLGLKCGLELHQQLNTNKLFCKCPSKILKDEVSPDKIIIRKLRAVASETGDFDLTAKEEEDKKKTFKYYFFNKCNCLVESDSQPPFKINQDALKTAIMISQLTNSSILDESYVMRKQVIDGSNVSGFQRTTMISTDGFIDFKFGRVRIDKILLEEDAARAISRSEKEAIYSLDRLGVPLIELVVWHDMHTPEQVKEVARFVGQLFRSTGKTKRGLGSIRQDINISITEGNRVEIKGCQDLENIPEIINREIIRQLNLIDVKKKLIEKNIPSFNLKSLDISYVFKNNKSKIILNSFNENKKMFLFKLPLFKGFLGKEIQPNRRIGTEIANVLKIRTNLKGLFHLDEMPNYGIEEKDLEVIKKDFNLNEQDSFIIVLCFDHEIESVRLVLEKRLNQLFDGVLKETRKVNIDLNTEYQRPLSTSSRMYPETDLSPIIFTTELIESVKKELPLSIEKRKELYIKDFKLNLQITNKMILSNFAPIFEKLVLSKKIDPKFLAIFLLEDLIKASRDKLIDLDDISQDEVYNFFSHKDLFNNVLKKDILEVFIEYIKNPNSLDIIISKNKKEDFLKEEIINIVNQVINENQDFVKKQKERSIGMIMGKVMALTNNKYDGSQISKIVKDQIFIFLK